MTTTVPRPRGSARWPERHLRPASRPGPAPL